MNLLNADNIPGLTGDALLLRCRGLCRERRHMHAARSSSATRRSSMALATIMPPAFHNKIDPRSHRPLGKYELEHILLKYFNSLTVEKPTAEE